MNNSVEKNKRIINHLTEKSSALRKKHQETVLKVDELKAKFEEFVRQNENTKGQL